MIRSKRDIFEATEESALPPLLSRDRLESLGSSRPPRREASDTVGAEIDDDILIWAGFGSGPGARSDVSSRCRLIDMPRSAGIAGLSRDIRDDVVAIGWADVDEPS